MKAYYNEIDPHAAAWLRSLIAGGLICPGDVDERSIEDVRPGDLKGYVQCHFFAGIGVWSYALRRAGWPDDRPVWTGSCPCQPFSKAGTGLGFDDERHLWPAWFHLIDQCRPDTVLGEQVASSDGLDWLDLVQDDMEGAAYAFSAVDICAAGFGAPHIRQRIYFAGFSRHRGAFVMGDVQHAERGTEHKVDAYPYRRNGSRRYGDAGIMADSELPERREGSVGGAACDGEAGGRLESSDRAGECSEPCWLADADGGNTGAERKQRSGEQRQQPQDGRTGILGVAAGSGSQGRSDGRVDVRRSSRSPVDRASGELIGPMETGGTRPGPTNGFWRNADWLLCRPETRYPEGAWRPIEPGTFPLVTGAPARMGRLRGYGNAINAEVATGFVEAVMHFQR